jgi:hypothetical protein
VLQRAPHSKRLRLRFSPKPRNRPIYEPPTRSSSAVKDVSGAVLYLLMVLLLAIAARMILRSAPNNRVPKGSRGPSEN